MKTFTALLILAAALIAAHLPVGLLLGAITTVAAVYGGVSSAGGYAFGTQPAGTYQDGVLVFGSQLVGLGASTYVADNIDFDQPVKVLTRNNQYGVPVAEVMIQDMLTGSMTLQLSAATPAAPSVGDVAQLTDVDGSTPIDIKITKVGRAFKAGEETKLNVEFRHAFQV